MSSRFGKVALLQGGDSPEREVSLASAAQVGEVLEGLCEQVLRFDPAERNLAELREEQVAAAFIMLHGGAGEDGSVQATLQSLGIPYTGARHKTCAVTMDKHLCKLLLAEAGLPTPPWLTVSAADDDTLNEIRLNLGQDVFVKPNGGGSSIASGRARGHAQMQAAITLALGADTHVMVEQFVEGMELTYGVLASEVLPGIHIDAGPGFYDYEAKYETDTTRYVCPPDVPAEVDAQARELTLAALRALDAQDCGWGRLDLFVSGRELFILEFNTVPGMTSHSLVPKAAAAAGMDMDELVARILEQAR